MKHIHTFESFLNERISDDAYLIHVMTGCGQDAAQNFIDDNGVSGKKLVDYLKNNPDNKYDVKHYITGTSGTVGGDKKLLQSFIKKMK